MGKQVEKTYSCVVTITAKDDDLADEMRAEIAGAAEDNHESQNVDAEATVGDLEPGDIDEKLEKYRALHGRVSALIEDGKLAGLKQVDSAAYEALVAAMTQLAGLDATPLFQHKAKSAPSDSGLVVEVVGHRCCIQVPIEQFEVLLDRDKFDYLTLVAPRLEAAGATPNSVEYEGHFGPNVFFDIDSDKDPQAVADALASLLDDARPTARRGKGLGL